MHFAIRITDIYGNSQLPPSAAGEEEGGGKTVEPKHLACITITNTKSEYDKV